MMIIKIIRIITYFRVSFHYWLRFSSLKDNKSSDQCVRTRERSLRSWKSKIIIILFDQVTLYNVLAPMQGMGNLGCFPRGKRAAMQRRYPASVLSMCAVFSCFHTTCCEASSVMTPTLFRHMDMGSLTLAHIWTRGCRGRGGGGGARHKVCARVDSDAQEKTQLFLTLPRQGFEPCMVFGFELSTL